MSVFTLQSGHHLAVAYYPPTIGPARFYVESEHPITVLAFDEANLNAWRNGLNNSPLARADGTREFRQEIFVPGGSGLLGFLGSSGSLSSALQPNSGRATWYLVMVNYDPALASAVYYSVQS